MKWIEQYNIDEDFFQYYSEDEKYLACLIYPHSGTDWKYMVRINKFETFDRWILAEIEEFFDTEDDARKFLNDFKGE